MTTQEIKTKLERLVTHWREKISRVEDRYGKLSPGPTQAGVTALTTCAEEVEELIKEIPGSTTHLVTTPPIE